MAEAVDGGRRRGRRLPGRPEKQRASQRYVGRRDRRRERCSKGGGQGRRGGFLVAFTLELRRCVREGGPNERQKQTLTRAAEEGDTSQDCFCSVRVREKGERRK